MLDWYENSQVCYAYLSDVEIIKDDKGETMLEFSVGQWFGRGWTLQELLAPQFLVFLDCDWNEIGAKSSLEEEIRSISGITHLFDFRDASIAQKMSWASDRQTTRQEDQAYCLMGIFDVNLPLLYGEGSRAFIRLQTEILKKSDDESIFAWEYLGCLQSVDGLLATSPSFFL